MSPQPAAPTAPAKPSLLDRIRGIDAADRTSAEKQILRASALEQQRSALMKQIASNREYLRLMDDNEELTDEEGDWLEAFYPAKEKGERRSEEDIERTRKAKEEARKANV